MVTGRLGPIVLGWREPRAAPDEDDHPGLVQQPLGPARVALSVNPSEDGAVRCRYRSDRERQLPSGWEIG